MKLFSVIVFLLTTIPDAFALPSVSPVLKFQQKSPTQGILKPSSLASQGTAPVTVRFSKPPDSFRLDELEQSGLTFTRIDGRILHTDHIYCAEVLLDSLDTLMQSDDIIRIESTFRPSITSTLDVSNPQVQASRIWTAPHPGAPIDGSGVVVTNVDTGIDIYHPGFFKADGGEYEWIDFNRSGTFDSGIDFVDLNGNGERESTELLRFFDSSFSDPLDLIDRNTGVFDADIDWLYNDSNRNGVRDYGKENGYGEDSPSYGELLFIISDDNRNNRLDPGEKLTALGTSKIIATFDKDGIHERGKNLLDSLGDTINHGTGSSGIVGGQLPGRRFTGMAPGVEFIVIDRINIDLEEGLIWSKDIQTDIILYEFASWVYEFLDGTSNLEMLISELENEGIHQFTASGNLAGPARKKHARLSVERAQTDSIAFSVPDIGATKIYFSLLWEQTFLSPNISLILPDLSAVPVTGDTQEYKNGQISLISGKDVSEKNTNRMDVVLSSESPIKGDFYIVLTNRRASAITIDAYISDNKTQWMNGTQFQNHLTDDGTVCSPGTAEHGVTVGAYDPRGTRNTKGDINDFSSWGKTIDGRRAVDITAPGTLVYSLTSHDAVGGQPGGYIDFGGTSASLPHVAGCAALIIQAQPGISPDNLARILFSGAQTDEFTGVTPNDIWGYGKLRIYDSLIESNIITYVENDIKPSVFSVSHPYPNPFNSSTSFIARFPTGNPASLDVSVFNIIGQRIYSYSIPLFSSGIITFSWNGTDITGSPVSTGQYFIRFSSSGHTISRKVLLIK